jgi:hypothetical protein
VLIWQQDRTISAIITLLKWNIFPFIAWNFNQNSICNCLCPVNSLLKLLIIHSNSLRTPPTLDFSYTLRDWTFQGELDHGFNLLSRLFLKSSKIYKDFLTGTKMSWYPNMRNKLDIVMLPLGNFANERLSFCWRLGRVKGNGQNYI